VWKSTSELGYRVDGLKLHAIEPTRLRRQRRVDGLKLHAIEPTRLRRQRRVDGLKLHAIEQTQLRRQHRVDGVGRPKFDFYTGTCQG
jgi:hypothetical protein